MLVQGGGWWVTAKALPVETGASASLFASYPALHAAGLFFSPRASVSLFRLSSQCGVWDEGRALRGFGASREDLGGDQGHQPRLGCPQAVPRLWRCLPAGQKRAGCLHTQSEREALLLSAPLLLLLLAAWTP